MLRKTWVIWCRHPLQPPRMFPGYHGRPRRLGLTSFFSRPPQGTMVVLPMVCLGVELGVRLLVSTKRELKMRGYRDQ